MAQQAKNNPFGGVMTPLRPYEPAVGNGRSRFGVDEEDERLEETSSRRRSKGSRSAANASQASSRTRSARGSSTIQARRGRSGESTAPAKRNRSAEASSSGKDTATRASKREERRRERVKARAEKMFTKQFSAESKAAADAPSEGAPRAAIYEGKMGATQRRSARMQRSTAASLPSVKINPAGWFASLPISTRSLHVGTAVLCTFLVCMFLYTPAQQYYQAQREHDRLVAEHSVIEERNNALDLQNDVLASDAGLEDAVRQKFGYVKAGEETAVVTGLSEHATDKSRDNEELEPAVLSSSVKAPKEWYTPLLDAFFGVS